MQQVTSLIQSDPLDGSHRLAASWPNLRRQASDGLAVLSADFRPLLLLFLRYALMAFSSGPVERGCGRRLATQTQHNDSLAACPADPNLPGSGQVFSRWRG
jgi:hypothetical protein